MSNEPLTLIAFREQVVDLKAVTVVTYRGKPLGRWIPDGVAIPEPERAIEPGSGALPSGADLRAMHQRQAEVLRKAFPQRSRG